MAMATVEKPLEKKPLALTGPRRGWRKSPGGVGPGVGGSQVPTSFPWKLRPSFRIASSDSRHRDTTEIAGSEAGRPLPGPIRGHHSMCVSQVWYGPKIMCKENIRIHYVLGSRKYPLYKIRNPWGGSQQQFGIQEDNFLEILIVLKNTRIFVSIKKRYLSCK